MSKQKYVFNEQTLQYEKLETNTTKLLLSGVAFIFSSIIAGGVIFAFSADLFPSPKEQSLNREINTLRYHYTNLTEDINKLDNDLSFLQEKDADIHRIIFGLEPLNEAVWNGGVGGSPRYQDLKGFKESGVVIKSSLEKVDLLKRQIELQKKSIDTIFNLALEREKMLMSIPSIKPVQEDKLKRNMRYLSGFGWRIHPIHKVKKFHKGVDFTAPRGTAIQATGDGVVKKVQKRKSGYGVNVMIDHGFGYTTLYAHMSKVNVKKGEKVKRGQKIGEVGSTGASTAPHCHYEVRKNGKAINPIDYCMDGLSTEEYQELVERATIENQSFD